MTLSVNMPVRIAIVDDKPQNRISLSEELGNSANLNVVLIARNGVDFLEQMKLIDASNLPQVVLMDIEMPEMDGIAAVMQSRVLYPEVYFLMLTIFDDEDKIFEAIRCGANGYLLKDENASVIEDYIIQMMEVGGVPMSPSIARKAMNMLIGKKSVVPVPSSNDSTSQHRSQRKRAGSVAVISKRL
ncbi:MAG: response regulator transcription factor [Saprospiraceae bacterium]|nr:response regulator transcription factor [Candidatus Vicinibacter affinis]